MGLSLTVGILTDLLEHDKEGAEWIIGHFEEINNVLAKAGFDQHVEPTDCEVWSADGYGYSGLHALREFAGLAWQKQPLPRTPRLTGREELSNSGKLFDAVLPFLDSDNKIGFFAKLLGKTNVKEPPAFSHLVCHSDAEGYYVPIDFSVPLIPNTMREETKSIWPVGSVQRLDAELDVLIELLEIPQGVNSQSESLWNAMDSDQTKPEDPFWLVQPIASYSALVLKEACSASLRTGAAIAFC